MPFPRPRHLIDQVVGRRSRAGTANPAGRRVLAGRWSQIGAKNVTAPMMGHLTLKLSAALMLTATAIGAARNGHAQGIRTTAGGRPPVGEALKQVLSPASVTTDNAGNYYIGDYNTASIYEASRDGEIRRATRRSSGLSFACCPFSANRGWAPGVTHFEARTRTAKNPARGNTVSPATHPTSDKRRRVVGKQPRHRFLAITTFPPAIQNWLPQYAQTRAARAER
jgi:hypothetical protein